MSFTPRPRTSRLLVLVGLGVVLCLAALALRESKSLARVRETLQARRVDASDLGSGDIDDILRRLRLIHPLPPAWARDTPSSSVPEEARARQRELISLDALAHDEISEILRVDPEWLDRGLPVLSLLVQEEDYQELIRRPNARGRATEKPGFVAYLEDGQLVFASGVGIRLHGGATRRYSMLRKFRLHFRDLYGADRFEPPIFSGLQGQPIRQLVIDNNNDGLDARGRRWHFVDPLSFDIARAIGAAAPETQPALFFLNGRLKGVYILTEYLGLDYLKARYGHDRFVLVRTKRNQRERRSMVKAGDPARHAEFLAWLEEPTTMTWSRAAERVDLDNLSRWFLTVLFCATGDVFNGPMLLDETDPKARWFWILWDLEIGFGQPYFPRRGGWQRDTIPYNFRERLRDPRSVLLRRLFADSSEFRRFFARLFSEAMNHRVTEQFLAERLRHYRELGRRSALRDTEFFDEIEEFLAHRKAALRQQMQQHLGAGPSYRVQVESPPDLNLNVDGHAKGSSYRGWYFAGQSLEVRLTSSGRDLAAAWTINGVPQAETRPLLRMTVDRDLTLRGLPSGRKAAQIPAVSPGESAAARLPT